MLSTDELNFSEYDYGHFAQSITFSTNDTGSPRSSQVTYQNGNQTVTLPIIQASATETVGLSVSAKSINYEQIRSANSWIISDLDDIGYYNTLVDAIINSGQYLLSPSPTIVMYICQIQSYQTWFDSQPPTQQL